MSKKLFQVLLAVVLMLQILGLTLVNVQAEGFVETPFENQWKATDQDVATGKASRTYFWGPSAFAHTNEVYEEASTNNGQRRVQYFDKARMELTKRENQDPNFVTNGLLTVELVTGRLQIGDNKFLQHSPSTSRVAGDQVNNERTPTYASFFNGKVIFGVEGAKLESDRTGQAINEAIDNQGQVSTLNQTAAALTYARFFKETNHNLADVFNRFFQVAPLGEDKWLSVMGYPISEPFWAKDQVMVGGKPKDVLIQLFQRRALTYTPSNPAGYQVEMGNIGQHYYAWRYNFNVQDELPGNFRFVYSLSKSLYSVSTRNPQDKIKIGDTSAVIKRLWQPSSNLVVVSTEKEVYLANLKAKKLKKLDITLNPSPLSVEVETVIGTTDGRYVAIFTGGLQVASKIYFYEIGANQEIISFFAVPNTNLNYYGVKMSADGKFLASLQINNDTSKTSFVHILNTVTKTYSQLEVGNLPLSITYENSVEWLGNSHNLFVSAARSDTANGTMLKVDVDSGAVSPVLSATDFYSAMISPDGNYFALLSAKRDAYAYATLTIRAMNDPTTDLIPGHTQGTVMGGRVFVLPHIVGWNADGTYVNMVSSAGGTAGAYYVDTSFVSIVNGKVIASSNYEGSYMSGESTTLAAMHELITIQTFYKGPDSPKDEKITIQNLDGSDKRILVDIKDHTYEQTFSAGKVVQIPK